MNQEETTAVHTAAPQAPPVQTKQTDDAESTKTDDKTENQDDSSSGSEDSDDSDSDDSTKNDNDDASNNNNANDKDSSGLSNYELLRLERIKRNQARLASLGLTEKGNLPKPKPKPQKKKKVSLDLVPTRELPSRAGRATFCADVKKREEEKNPDACFVCQKEEGELMCCDYCRTLYHPTCHPTTDTTSTEGFRCQTCVSLNKKRRVACGHCSACNRSQDCETCVVCVNNHKGYMKAKCIFRRCQSWGMGVLVKDKGEEGEESGDKHDSECHVCKDGGDVICCDNCSKVFHSNCHKPKIYSLPEGEWTCMYCTVKPEKKPLYKPKYGESLLAVMGGKEWTVNLKWPTLCCKVCDGKQTTGPVLNLEWTSCRTCSKTYHLKCLDPPLERRPNKWRCRTCKMNKKTKEKKVKEKVVAQPKNEKLFDGVHDDDCYMCYNGGDLVCCDYCSKVFHLQCHIPPLLTIPKGTWKCCECAAVEYKRMMRCGECDACLREDCGKCTMCRDKPKFGGPGRLKQTCEMKKCGYMRLAPPASRKSLSDKDVKEQFKLNSEKKSERKRKEPSSLNNGVDGQPRLKKFKPLQREGSNGTPHMKGIMVSGVFIPPHMNTSQPNTNALQREGSNDPPHMKGIMKSGVFIPPHMNTTSQPNTNNPSSVKKPKHPKKSPKSTTKTPDKEQVAPNKPISSLAMSDAALVNDPVGSKIRTIISTALNKPDNPSVQEHACQYLRVFITDDKSVNMVIRLGGLLMMAKSMCTYPTNIQVQIEVTKTLTKMAVRSPSCVDAILGSVCVGLAIESMKTHTKSLEVHQAVCSLLRALSYDFRTHLLIIRAQGLEEVLSSLKSNSQRLDALSDGCCFLQNILCNAQASMEAMKLFLSHGIVQVISKGISQFPQENYLCAACGLLANLAFHDSSGLDAQCITNVLSILQLNVSVDVKTSAMYVLKASVSNKEYTQVFLNNDGVKKVVSLMKLYPTDGYLIVCGLQLMKDLIKSVNNTQWSVDADEFNIMTYQMSRNQTSKFIHACGCSILRRLSLPSIGDERAGECVKLVLSALGKFRDDLVIQFDGRHALLNILAQYPSVAPLLHASEIRCVNNKLLSDDESDGEFEAMFVENEPGASANEHAVIDYTSLTKDDPVCVKVKNIVAKASNHLSDNKAQDKACEHLRKLIRDDRSAEKVIQLGGIEMIEGAMKAHPDKAVVQWEACATLADLIWKYSKSSKRIHQTQCLALVVIALNNHTNHVKVQQFGCAVFGALSYENKNHYFINRVDGLEVVLSAMNQNIGKLVVLKEVCLFLQNMLSNPSFPSNHIHLIISKNAIPIIIDTMQGCSDINFLDPACGTIKNLAINNEARSAVGKYQQSIPSITSVLASDLDKAVSKGALDALKMLAGDEDNRTQMRQNNQMKPVISFITNNSNDLGVVEAGFNLLVEFTKSKSLIDEVGVFEFVTTGMKNHQTESSIQETGSQILGNLKLKTEEEAKLALNLILTTSIKNHSNDSSIQLSGLCALLNICSNHPTAAPVLRLEENVDILGKMEMTRDE